MAKNLLLFHSRRAHCGWSSTWRIIFFFDFASQGLIKSYVWWPLSVTSIDDSLLLFTGVPPMTNPSEILRGI